MDFYFQIGQFDEYKFIYLFVAKKINLMLNAVIYFERTVIYGNSFTSVADF